MNIIEAREAALAGKTVITPYLAEWTERDFKSYESESARINVFNYGLVFGEWRVKQEPVVFEAEVSIANEKLYGPGVGMIASRDMRPLIGKRVKVTVEVLP